jgi:hypothetical protein
VRRSPELSDFRPNNLQLQVVIDAHLFSTDRANPCDEFVTIELIDCRGPFAHSQAHRTTVGESKNGSLIGVVLPADISHQLHRFNQRLLQDITDFFKERDPQL